MNLASLRLRLVAAGALAIAGALLLAGAGLAHLFERHLMRALAADLEIDLRQAIASVDLDPTGRPRLARSPSDPRFDDPLSGLYWQVGSERIGLLRSRSLWDSTLPLPDDTLAPGEIHQHRITGPAGRPLLAIERTVLLTFDGAPRPVRLVIASDLEGVTRSRLAFVADLVIALALLGLVLAVATFVQISLGLRPLNRLREGMAAIRAGRAKALPEAVPSEVAPLVDEINAFLAEQDESLERARGRAADLAHGLKTPLAALAADVRTLRERGESETADRIAEIGETMRRHIERELARARIRGKRTLGPAARTPLSPLVSSLVSIQRRTEAGSRLQFDVEIPEAATISMERADLAEVLGNLLENAARHAHSRVRLTISAEGGVAIDDDGPGIPEALRGSVLARGQRLDERPDGAGLGLAIVQEVLDAYDRKLVLASSDLGGLRVEV